MIAVIICSDFGAPKIKFITLSPSICHEVMGPDAMILVFWMLSFKHLFLLYWLHQSFWLCGSQQTVENSERISHCTCEIKTCLLLGRKVMTNLDSILKNRDITLPTKVYLVKAMVFPVVMYGCESWTIKKAEHWRIDAFQLWCWRRLLRVAWTTRRSNQFNLKEISLEYSLEGLILKLKLQYFGPPDAKNWLIWKDPDAGKNWRQE